MNYDRVWELEKKIEDLKARMPAHSVPIRMIEELEALEDELAAAKVPASRTISEDV